MNKFSIVLIGVLFLTGCGLLPSAYKVPVSQGNVLKMEKVDQIKIGMTKSQVKFLIGSPIITDQLEPDMWLYKYMVTDADDKTEISDLKKLTLIFDNDQVIDINKN